MENSPETRRVVRLTAETSHALLRQAMEAASGSIPLPGIQQRPVAACVGTLHGSVFVPVATLLMDISAPTAMTKAVNNGCVALTSGADSIRLTRTVHTSAPSQSCGGAVLLHDQDVVVGVLSIVSAVDGFSDEDDHRMAEAVAAQRMALR